MNKKLNIVKYWKHSKSDAKYTILLSKEGKTEFEFEYKKIKTKINVNLIWEHNIINLTWVISFCYDIWFKTTEIKKYLKNLKTPKNTLDIKTNKNHILIDDTYNLSENWLYAWLDVLNTYKWEKILVLDDILEIWKQSKEIHYEIWKKIAKEKLVNKIFFVWVNYKKNIEKWLKENWFTINNILNTLENIEDKSTILFEWKKSKNYLNNISKNV